MLSSVFLGNDASLKSYQMQFLPMERVSWERLQARGVLSATSRHDGPSLRLISAPHASRRRLGDHPLMYDICRGVTTREIVKALLLLLFPLSYMECRRRANTVTSGGSTSSRSGGPVAVAASKGPMPPPAALPAAAHKNTSFRRRGTTAGAPMTRKDDRIARALRSADTTGTVARVSLNDVVPLDDVSGVLSLDVPQLLCYLFLPTNYVLQHPDGDDDLHTLPTDVALEVFRASRSLCAWTRWVQQRQKAAGGIVTFEDIEGHFTGHIVDRGSLSAPLMFPTPTREKAMRFMDLRSLGPQSIVAFMHMLSVFLTDTFELAFTRSAVSKLRAAVTSSSTSDFLHTLDLWRFEDGWEHVRQLLAAYPTQEALTQATAEDIVRVSRLMLPTPSHRMHLQRSVEAMPRRTFAATSNVLLNASVPLGSVAAEQRAARRRAHEAGDDDAGDGRHSFPHVKLGLVPSSMQQDYFDTVLLELLTSFATPDKHAAGPSSCTLAAADVWMRMASSSSGAPSTAFPSLEDVVIERTLDSAANSSVAQFLAGSSVSRVAVQRMQSEKWSSERTSLADLRPLTAGRSPRRPERECFGASYAQEAQLARAHVYDRNARALLRAKRHHAPTLPTLSMTIPQEEDWAAHRGNQPPNTTHVDDSNGLARSSAAHPTIATSTGEKDISRWRLDPESEVTTSLPLPIEGLSRMQIFEFFHNGPASLRAPNAAHVAHQ